MKKRNFITGFSAAFVATIALVSCGGVRSKDGVVLTIGGHEYTAQELFNGQKTPAAAEAKFNAVYKVAVRRFFDKDQEGNNYMPDITRDTKLKVAGAKEEAKTNASKNGTKYKTEWEKILSSNGVDDEDGLYDKFEYDLMKTKFDDVFYSRQVTETTEGGKKYNTNYDVLRQGGQLRDKDGKGVGSKIDGYFTTKQPYHMKHILVKIGAADKDNTNGLISKDDANKIYSVITALAKGTPFEQVSNTYNEDTEAKKHGGNLGIMSRDTGFVNDFKLGTYMYEAFFGSSTNKNGADAPTPYNNMYAKEALGLDTNGEDPKKGTAAYYADKISKLDDPTTTYTDDQSGKIIHQGIGQIPYGEVLKFANSYNITREKDDQHSEPTYDGVADMDYNKFSTEFKKYEITEVKEKFYPRNVIFNKYFNKHNIMVITKDDAPEFNENGTSGKVEKLETYYTKSGTDKPVRTKNKDNAHYKGDTLDSRINKLEGFKTKGKNNDQILGKLCKQDVLRDENGRVILVFRSGTSSSSTSNADTYQGIHFVVIERSPFINEEVDTGETDPTTLNEYYTQYYPKESGDLHPKYIGKDKYKRTYANWIPDEVELANQKSRSDTVKSELKKADDNLNTYVYEYLVAKGDIHFTSTAGAQNIEKSITDWITNTKRESASYEKEKKWNETWRTYYNSLSAQFEQRRETIVGDTIVSKIVPEICVYAFQNKYKESGIDLNDFFGVGGVFHD